MRFKRLTLPICVALSMRLRSAAETWAAQGSASATRPGGGRTPSCRVNILA